MALKPSPIQYVLAGFGAGFAPHFILLLPTPPFVPLFPGSLGQEPSPTVGAHTALHSSPHQRHPQAHRDAQSPPHQHWDRRTDRQTDGKAHPPPLIRLRSESTSSAPSMATSSCGKRRKLMWKPTLCSIQALLLLQLRGGASQMSQMSPELGPPWCQPDQRQV